MIGAAGRSWCWPSADRDTGLHSGLTSNYVEVVFDGPDGLARRFAPVTITGVTADHTFAAIEEATA